MTLSPTPTAAELLPLPLQVSDQLNTPEGGGSPAASVASHSFAGQRGLGGGAGPGSPHQAGSQLLNFPGTQPNLCRTSAGQDQTALLVQMLTLEQEDKLRLQEKMVREGLWVVVLRMTAGHVRRCKLVRVPQGAHCTSQQPAAHSTAPSLALPPAVGRGGTPA